MDKEQSIAVPLAIGAALLAVAIIWRGWFGILLGLGGLVPGGYITWLGTQAEKQNRFVLGLGLMIVSLVIAGLLLLGRVLNFLT